MKKLLMIMGCPRVVDDECLGRIDAATGTANAEAESISPT